MEDISNMLAMKRWRRIRSTSSLWATFIRNKYCVRSHFGSKKIAPGNSHAWSHILKMRDIAENHIVWQVNSGSSNFWWDNCSLNGPLEKLFPDNPRNSKLLVREFISDGQWNTNKLKELLPDQLVQQIQIIPIGIKTRKINFFGLSRIMASSQTIVHGISYGDQKNFNKYRLKQQITCSIEAAVNKAYPNSGLKLPWNSFCDTLTRLRPGYKSFVVRWLKPDMGWVMLNTDGSFLQREGKASLGGTVRDEYGDIIMAFSTPATAQNHNIAEAQAALCGLNWCKQNGFSQVILELDSLYIIEILRKDGDTNYKLSHIVNKIKDTINMLNIQIKHCYREANQLADSLAKRAVELQQSSHFESSHQLPRQAKGLYLLDK
ncbi:uncharacterized protein LOC142163350 [Nicotiana tabacum]|uniref:Uncharacterized protein LOC142163350 n=1 Tax=Nicotiana tabacum TaxID=4097 RepID=A0AC58RVH4_TOBAC